MQSKFDARKILIKNDLKLLRREQDFSMRPLQRRPSHLDLFNADPWSTDYEAKALITEPCVGLIVEMDVLKILRRNGGINSEAPQKSTCFNILRHGLGLATHLFVKVARPEVSEGTFSVFESSCHLLLPV